MASSGGYVYAIGAEGTSLVKIGCAKMVEKRLKTLQTGQPFPLYVLAAVPVAEDIHRIEKQVHAFLAEERRRGEWFAVEMDTARLEALIVRAVTYLAEAKSQQQQTAEDSCLHGEGVDIKGLPVMHRLAIRLRALRVRRGLSQARLGGMIKKDGQYISKIERGVLPGATIQVLEQLIETLGCSADYLLGRGADDEDEEEAA
jgi:ribosome-binding protein aMBF1 (putative translation factor)